jgi:LPS-assembly protein
MKSILAIALALAVFLPRAGAGTDGWSILSLSRFIPGAVDGQVEYGRDGTVTGTNGVLVRYQGATLSADRVRANYLTGEVQADGDVRLETGDMLWVGEHVTYNFKNRKLETGEFRAGKLPVLVGGARLNGDNSKTNRVYTANDADVTTDDVSEPDYRIRARRVEIVPGEYVNMWNAVVYVEGVPVFYFPYYHRSLGKHASHFTLKPGFRSEFGPYLFGTYEWFAGDTADGKIRADFRAKRGPGLGPEANLHLGEWGEAHLKYYYVNDNDPNYSTNRLPVPRHMPRNRERVTADWQVTPATNFNFKAQVNYQSDPLMLHDFFEGEYTADPQRQTFFEANKYWDNWSLDALTTPELNNFFDQVERLPDVRLTGFRQQVFDTPVYYDSQSSIGYYKKFFANTNTPGDPLFANTNYSAARIDTYHQVSLPWTFFDWLNVAPRAGGRWTYYGDATMPNGQLYDHQTYRTVFNTGVRASFKVSRLWAEATNSLLQVDGLRHVMEPSADYVYVPNPSRPPSALPQFDSEFPGLMLSPVEFPDYSSIDSVDAQNVIRYGLRNTLQTKRDGEVENLLDWNLLLDWRLSPTSTESTFNDLYSAVSFRPRTWLALQSQVRYDVNDGKFNLAFHQVQFTPNNRWSWGLGHWYLRHGFPSTTDPGDNFLTSTLFYRLNDNWGLRLSHDFNARNQRLQEQDYTVYRDAAGPPPSLSA